MNSFTPVDPSLVDVTLLEDGYPDNLAAEDTRDALMSAVGDGARDMPDALRVPKSEWADRAHDNDTNKTWPLNYIDRFTNQNPTHECTCHSLSKGFEAARNRARGVQYMGPIAGQRLPASADFGSVWVSPLSVYSEANPRQWGGASCRGVLEIAVKRGFLPETVQPREYGFKHAIQGTTGKGGINQAHGDWLPLSRFPEGWKETAANFKVLEVIFPDSWEDIVSLVLNGYVVNVGRNGHAIPYTHWNEKDQLLGYTDSYDIIRWDSVRTIKSAVGGASAIATVTTPDDWLKPAA